jgi:hypothetical protein
MGSQFGTDHNLLKPLLEREKNPVLQPQTKYIFNLIFLADSVA